MASFDSALPHFTNQLAYQSVFAPPGFSFESPFAYPQPSSSSNGSGVGSSTMQQQQSHGKHAHEFGVDLEMGMNSYGHTTIQPEGSAMTAMHAGAGMYKSVWPMSVGGEKVDSPSLHSLFPSPSIRLNTGDRFSQLLEEKLGMDRRNTSTAFQAGAAPVSAPPHLSSHNIPQPGPYSTYALSPLPPQQPSFPPFASSAAVTNGQTWDHLAIESNLQDFNQVQIQPDLVAPVPPSSYFHLGGVGGIDDVGGLTMPVASGSVPHAQPQLQTQTPAQGLYTPFSSTESFQNPMSAPSFPVQASPHSMSARSSPSNHPSQLGTPQTALQPIPPPGDMRWTASTPFTPLPPTSQSTSSISAVPLPRHAHSQPLLRHTSADNTPYPSFQRIRLDPPGAASPSSSANSATVPAPPVAVPPPQSQSFPGANGSWASEMAGSSSSASASANFQPLSGSHLQPVPTYSQPLSRSASQHTWAPAAPLPEPQFANQFDTTHIRTGVIPSSFPPAPQLSKRSRSPQSHKSSPTYARSLSDGKEGLEGTKRPKLSVPMNIPNPNPTSTSGPGSGSQGHSDEDGEKKIVIACHTCRARKLKCDGARPKCHHCSRRNEDACVYDAVLRRRGPGKKNKKTKGESGLGDHHSASPTDEMPSSSARQQYGSRFELSTERS